jgi:TonB family protein
MKTGIFLSALLFLSGTAFAQSSSYSFGDNPSTTLTRLKTATTIHDISPLIWRFIGLPARDRFELDYRRKLDSVQGYYIQPAINNYPNIVNLVFVEITTVSNGRKQSAHNTSETLNEAQKNILNMADISSNIEITIRYLYKQYGEDNTPKEGRIAITVLPETEAKYIKGGFDELANYLNDYVAGHTSSVKTKEAVQYASIVFTVNEHGNLEHIVLRRLSGDKQADQLLLEALHKMPKWKPARNAKGATVKQTIHFTFGGC